MRKAIFWFGLMVWFAFPLPTLAERVLVQGELVEFSSKVGDSALAIGCRPLTAEATKTNDWIDECNDLGREALDDAAEAGLITHVEGVAFGMASEFFRDFPPARSARERTLAREVPLLPGSI